MVDTLFSLHPWFITGFVDGEGCFIVSVSKKSKLKSGWELSARFQIGLNTKDKLLLDRIQAYFGVGIVYKAEINVYRYIVTRPKELRVIIDHFDKYPRHNSETC
jgi:hypothetical protein